MRQLISKYSGECAQCGNPYSIGTPIMYEKMTGCFCVGCQPTDVDAIRAFRQAKIDKKNERREGWARAREKRAEWLQKRCDSLMGRDRSPDGRADWALVTQPGHIPQRAQANRLQERSWEELQAADEHRKKTLYPARVAGDAERFREAKRAKMRESLSALIGTEIKCHPYGMVKLLRVNDKTATVQTPSGYKDRVCITWVYLPISASEGGAK